MEEAKGGKWIWGVLDLCFGLDLPKGVTKNSWNGWARSCPQFKIIIYAATFLKDYLSKGPFCFFVYGQII